MSDIRVDGSSTLLAFLAGTVIGIGLGVLIAPKPGRETRQQLADIAHKGKERATEAAEKIRHKVEEGVDVVREKIRA